MIRSLTSVLLLTQHGIFTSAQSGAPARSLQGPLLNTNRDCFDSCWKTPGFCDWCGFGNACCKAGGNDGDPPECNGDLGYRADGRFHECVKAAFLPGQTPPSTAYHGPGSLTRAQAQCISYMSETGCSWTERLSCPGQKTGIQGVATPDLTEGYKCCCENQLWKESGASTLGGYNDASTDPSITVTPKQCRKQSCDWTEDFSCKGQPRGRKGRAGDDGSEGYQCCCGLAFWRQKDDGSPRYRQNQQGEFDVDAGGDFGDNENENSNGVEINVKPGVKHGPNVGDDDFSGEPGEGGLYDHGGVNYKEWKYHGVDPGFVPSKHQGPIYNQYSRNGGRSKSEHCSFGICADMDGSKTATRHGLRYNRTVNPNEVKGAIVITPAPNAVTAAPIAAMDSLPSPSPAESSSASMSAEAEAASSSEASSSASAPDTFSSAAAPMSSAPAPMSSASAPAPAVAASSPEAAAVAASSPEAGPEMDEAPAEISAKLASNQVIAPLSSASAPAATSSAIESLPSPEPAPAPAPVPPPASAPLASAAAPDLASAAAPVLASAAAPVVAAPSVTAAPAPTPAPTAPAPAPAVQSPLSVPVKAGATILQVEAQTGFNVGDYILVGGKEKKKIVGFGSIMLDSPLQNSYPAGTTIAQVSDPAPGTYYQGGGPNTSNSSGIGALTALLVVCLLCICAGAVGAFIMLSRKKKNRSTDREMDMKQDFIERQPIYHDVPAQPEEEMQQLMQEQEQAAMSSQMPLMPKEPEGSVPLMTEAELGTVPLQSSLSMPLGSTVAPVAVASFQGMPAMGSVFSSGLGQTVAAPSALPQATTGSMFMSQPYGNYATPSAYVAGPMSSQLGQTTSLTTIPSAGAVYQQR